MHDVLDLRVGNRFPDHVGVPRIGHEGDLADVRGAQRVEDLLLPAVVGHGINHGT